MTDPLLISVLLPFAVALVAPILVRWLGYRAGWLLALTPAAIFASATRYLPVAPGDAERMNIASRQ